MFTDGRVLAKSRPNGPPVKIAEFDRPADNASLACSNDGSTIFLLSAQRDRAYVVVGQSIGEYELATSSRLSKLRMSPDGSLFVLEQAKFVHGVDLLASKRLIKLNVAEDFGLGRVDGLSQG